MLDVVLFYPKLETVRPRLTPMSLLSIAAPLVAEGLKVKIIDQRVNENWKETLVESLKEKPSVVGFSVMTGKQILNALEANKIVKENSDIVTVWGGVHPSLLSEQTLENEDVDFVVVGEGEKIFLDLVKNIKFGENYKNIPGLGYKEKDEIVINPRSEFVDMNDLPDTPYHLINTEDYIQETSFASGKEARSIDLYTSRGCPHRCAFCYNQLFNKRRWRGMSAKRVVGLMEKFVKEYNITAFDVEDDEFFVDMNRAKRVCELIIEKGLDVEIFATCRANYVSQRMDDELLDLCRRAGFKTLAFGVESGSPRIQKMMSKDITTDQVFDTIKKLKKAKIASKYYFMAGLPGETTEDLYKTTDLIQQMKELDDDVRIPAWRIFTPYPGTELYEKSQEMGFELPNSLEQWADYDFKTIQMPWVDRRSKRIIKNVAYGMQYLDLRDSGSKNIYYRLGRMYGKTVDLRFKKHWFFFPEKYLINLIKKIRHGKI